ncbi:HAD-superfamily hydrolase, subfamily IA, variant 1 family protein [Oceanicola granulosus HTCC2516]|uniref:phosphoglycolate phosphatase n=1 Tax=Oceanicola granulosus (strain ATCC BAA-861 / DSM 15982 / KCTC 12143 / HTCC2516) TaxID=314256 RepID=Q2C9S0_OCEGH|nr:HAD family hydrolase [Oceanicola granulosus]EAR49430.1 HAD-superfamily hydrolase, subfamily IA, variant 1 family protein [Oceanicola granulosus HTCC2516]
MSAPIEAILFDKDGTLYDFNATWGAWTMGLLEEVAEGDPVLVEALAEVLGYDTERKRFRKGSPVIAEPAGEVAALMLPFLPPQPLSALVERMNDLAALAPQVEVCDLRALLEGFAADGLALGIATNDAAAPARAHLAASGIVEAFDFIAGADSGHGAKPGPGQLHAFCAATGRRAGACVMVGDSSHDMLAGRQAGMTCVAVLTGPAERADLAPLADVVLESVADLPAWVRAQG